MFLEASLLYLTKQNLIFYLAEDTPILSASFLWSFLVISSLLLFAWQKDSWCLTCLIYSNPKNRKRIEIFHDKKIKFSLHEDSEMDDITNSWKIYAVKMIWNNYCIKFVIKSFSRKLISIRKFYTLFSFFVSEHKSKSSQHKSFFKNKYKSAKATWTMNCSVVNKTSGYN